MISVSIILLLKTQKIIEERGPRNYKNLKLIKQGSGIFWTKKRAVGYMNLKRLCQHAQ